MVQTAEQRMHEMHEEKRRLYSAQCMPKFVEHTILMVLACSGITWDHHLRDHILMRSLGVLPNVSSS